MAKALSSVPSSSGKGKRKQHPLTKLLYSLWSRSGKKAKEDSPAWMRLYPHFKLEEIRKAANNFDPNRKVHEDASYTVYEGSLNGDSYKYPVSIMRFKPKLSYKHKFLAEMELLSKLHHPNIVSLIGYSIDGSKRIIVHSPMANGTLHDHLHKKSSAAPLPWKRRLQICIGIARGIECLHKSNPLIIHRDIKSRSIILDRNWVAKISNFQTSKLVSPSLLEPYGYVSADVVGTIGYVDPEYFKTGQLTLKSDVYSFAVVLFEVLSGRHPVQEGTVYLTTWARHRMERSEVDEIIDPRIRDEISPDCLKAYADLAYKCSNERPDDRPAIGEAVKRLQLALLLQECVEASIPFSPFWLRSIVSPPLRSEPLVDTTEGSETSYDYDFEDLLPR